MLLELAGQSNSSVRVDSHWFDSDRYPSVTVCFARGRFTTCNLLLSRAFCGPRIDSKLGCGALAGQVAGRLSSVLPSLNDRAHADTGPDRA